MKNKIIEAILKAEVESDKIEEKAKLEAVKIVSLAEEENLKIKNSAQENSKKLLKQKLEEVEEKFKQDYLTELDNYLKEANSLEDSAKKNFDKAIDIILKKITK